MQEYTIRANVDGAQIFQGRGVYRFTKGKVDGFWEDSEGAIHPLTGHWNRGVLTVLWGEPGSQLGRSRYALHDNRLIVTDWSLEFDGWRQFMETQYEATAEKTTQLGRLPSALCDTAS